ncbi:serine/threonine protein phosphatase [Roseovarius faecimaris]|uniref:Serine/threonine protein phosphatase n=1 Tax=Roseovarius faecimaris TaxID=2494550 RepID=A0A6I6IWL0_9RHOB|nr:metallophosphoesterase family protein [Roseovarius faecimaris]QGY00022.1 serine/threonine protein phosphatase [Roseovarius faecimaris]
MQEPLYVIPDIHGYKDKLDAALGLIEAEGGVQARVVFLGDLVDRGPDSRGVIQTLIDGIAEGRDWTVIRGNHDQLFLEFLDSGQITSPRLRDSLTWISKTMGAQETLASYGITVSEADPNWNAARQAVPDAHRAFLASLPLTLHTEDLILVHAGIMPGVPLGLQTAEDLMWIREPFLSDPRDHGKLIVHGHSPVQWPEHHGNRVALDGGAGWGRDLHVAVFEGRDCWLLSTHGREALLPRDVTL